MLTSQDADMRLSLALPPEAPAAATAALLFPSDALFMDGSDLDESSPILDGFLADATLIGGAVWCQAAPAAPGDATGALAQKTPPAGDAVPTVPCRAFRPRGRGGRPHRRRRRRLVCDMSPDELHRTRRANKMAARTHRADKRTKLNAVAALRVGVNVRNLVLRAEEAQLHATIAELVGRLRHRLAGGLTAGDPL